MINTIKDLVAPLIPARFKPHSHGPWIFVGKHVHRHAPATLDEHAPEDYFVVEQCQACGAYRKRPYVDAINNAPVEEGETVVDRLAQELGVEEEDELDACPECDARKRTRGQGGEEFCSVCGYRFT